MGRGIMLIQIFVLKVINDERKILTHHEIVDRIAEKIVLVITQVCKELKFRIRLSSRRSRLSFTYSFKFTYFCNADAWTLKKEFSLRK